MRFDSGQILLIFAFVNGDRYRKIMNEKTLKIVSFLMLGHPVFYGMVLVIMQMNGVHHPYHFAPAFYAVFLPVFAALFSMSPARNYIWQRAKNRGVTSTSQFFKMFFIATIVPMALSDAVGIMGLVLFVLTGNLYLSITLIAVSALAKLFQFPTNDYILNKKKEFPFCINDASCCG